MQPIFVLEAEQNSHLQSVRRGNLSNLVDTQSFGLKMVDRETEAQQMVSGAALLGVGLFRLGGYSARWGRGIIGQDCRILLCQAHHLCWRPASLLVDERDFVWYAVWLVSEQHPEEIKRGNS